MHTNSEGYLLIPLRECDIEQIRIWRNEQIDILRQNEPISQEEQRAYYEGVILPATSMKHPPQMLLSFLHHDTLLGYGGLVHIDWHSKKAEISFLLDSKIPETSPEFALHFSHFTKILLQIAFQELGLHKIVAVVFDLRPAMPQLLEMAGFEREGVLKEHVFKRGKWHNAILYGLITR